MIKVDGNNVGMVGTTTELIINIQSLLAAINKAYHNEENFKDVMAGAIALDEEVIKEFSEVMVDALQRHIG